MNVDYIIGSLLEKDLITIRGRAEVVGRPMLYGSTDNLLEYLGLNSLEDLPHLKAIEEIIKSSPPEGVSQSDIDFYEEINMIREKITSGANSGSDLDRSDNDPDGIIHELNPAGSERSIDVIVNSDTDTENENAEVPNEVNHSDDPREQQ